MRFYEYESRAIVRDAGIPVTDFGFAKTPEEAREIAAADRRPDRHQVAGAEPAGRMKAGGVQFADTPDEAAAHAEAILQLEIGGHMPRGVLVDPRPRSSRSTTRAWSGTAPRKRPLMLFSDMGGIDIEQVAEEHPDHVGRRHFSNLLPFSDFQAKQAIADVGRDRHASSTGSPRSWRGSRGCSGTAT